MEKRPRARTRGGVAEMPGIHGLACQTPTSLSHIVHGMGNRMKRHPWYVEDRFLDESAGGGFWRISLGFINPESQPAFNEDRSLAVVLDGEIYDYSEQRRALVAAGHVFRGDSYAELLTHGYEQRGAQFFAGLHGKFVAALWNFRDRRLVLV